MDVFEYVIVMVTVVLAIGVSHIFTSIASIIASIRSIEISWVCLGWIMIVLGLHLSAWFRLWMLRDLTQWRLVEILTAFLSTGLIYTAARVLVPDIQPNVKFDLGEHFGRIRIAFFVTLSTFFLWVSVAWLFVFPTGAIMAVTPMTFFVLSVSGALIGSIRYHYVLVVVSSIAWVGTMVGFGATIAN